MHVPGWKPALWRRAQLIWIAPLFAVAYLPCVLWEGARACGNPLKPLSDIWKGRP